MTRIKVFDVRSCGAAISRVAQVLRDGEIVIFPTDTVYAIGCSMHDLKAIKQLCRIKGGDTSAINLSFLCKDFAQASQYLKPLNSSEFKLLKHHLPGPFTFILNASNEVPKALKNKKKTVGIRIPDNAMTLALIEELGCPILSTSIHTEDETEEYVTDPELILEKYCNEAKLIMDGGAGGVIPSTVVDCTGEEWVVVREGLGKLNL